MDTVDFKIKRRQNWFSGIKLIEHDHITVFLANPVDYVLDSFGILNRKYLQNEMALSKDNMKSEILLKKLDRDAIPKYLKKFNSFF